MYSPFFSIGMVLKACIVSIICLSRSDVVEQYTLVDGAGLFVCVYV